MSNEKQVFSIEHKSFFVRKDDACQKLRKFSEGLSKAVDNFKTDVI